MQTYCGLKHTVVYCGRYIITNLPILNICEKKKKKKKEGEMKCRYPVITWLFIQNSTIIVFVFVFAIKVDHAPLLSTPGAVNVIDFFMSAALTQAGVSSLGNSNKKIQSLLSIIEKHYLYA